MEMDEDWEEAKLKRTKWQRFVYRNDEKIKKVIIVIIGVVLLLVIFTAAGAVQKRLTYNNALHLTIKQMEQLIDNIRTIYITSGPQANVIQILQKMGAIPNEMVSDNRLRHPFGGGVTVMPALPIKDERGIPIANTFKLAYQNLPYQACIDLAQINWGGSESGLIAEAIGVVDASGNDNALHDVDYSPEKRRNQQYLFNVGFPDNAFMPAPFSLDRAEDGCQCGQYKTCSFVLKYAISIKK